MTDLLTPELREEIEALNDLFDSWDVRVHRREVVGGSYGDDLVKTLAARGWLSPVEKAALLARLEEVGAERDDYKNAADHLALESEVARADFARAREALETMCKSDDPWARQIAATALAALSPAPQGGEDGR